MNYILFIILFFFFVILILFTPPPSNNIRFLVEEDISLKELSINEPKEYLAHIDKNELMTPIGYKNEVRIIKIKHSNLEFQPGDSVLIRAKNNIENVEKLIELMKWESIKDQYIKVDFLKESIKFKDFIEQYIDLSNLNKSKVSLLQWIYYFLLTPYSPIHYDKDRIQQCIEKLEEWFQVLMPFSKLLKKEEEEEIYNDYYEYIIKSKRTDLEIIIDFLPSINPIYLMDLFQLILPRAYSIANFEPNIQILFNLINFQSTMKLARMGLTTNWLKSLGINIIDLLDVGSTLVISLLCSQPSMDLSDRPALFIATGTGIAPIRSIIQFRNQKKIKGKITNLKVKEIIYFLVVDIN